MPQPLWRALSLAHPSNQIEMEKLHRLYQHNQYVHEYTSQHQKVQNALLDTWKSLFRSAILPDCEKLSYKGFSNAINAYGRSGLEKAAQKYGPNIDHLTISPSNKVHQKSFDAETENYISLGFVLENFSGLRSLKLCVGLVVTDAQFIDRFNKLESVTIECSLDENIDISRLTKLVYLNIDHNLLTDSIPHLPSLNILCLGKFKGHNFYEFEFVPHVQQLILTKSSKLESLTGISHLSHLQYLSVCSANRLSSLYDLGSLKRLEYLLFENCSRIIDIDEATHCEALKYLQFSGCKNLGNLLPLNQCSNLEHLYLINNTKVDASYDTVVLKLPKLRFTKTGRPID